MKMRHDRFAHIPSSTRKRQGWGLFSWSLKNLPWIAKDWTATSETLIRPIWSPVSIEGQRRKQPTWFSEGKGTVPCFPISFNPSKLAWLVISPLSLTLYGLCSALQLRPCQLDWKINLSIQSSIWSIAHHCWRAPFQLSVSELQSILGLEWSFPLVAHPPDSKQRFIALSSCSLRRTLNITTIVFQACHGPRGVGL